MRKKSLFTVLHGYLCISLWAYFIVAVFSVNPQVVKNVIIDGIYLPMVVLIFVCILVTLLLRYSFWKAFRWAMMISFLFVMRFVGVGHVLNILLVLGSLVAFEYFGHFKRLDSE